MQVLREELHQCAPAEVRADRLKQAIIIDLKKVISNTGYPQFPKNLLQMPMAAKKNDELKYHSIPAFTSSGGVCGTLPRASCVSGSNGSCTCTQKMETCDNLLGSPMPASEQDKCKVNEGLSSSAEETLELITASPLCHNPKM
jgi:hypothetical protein